MDDDPRNSQTTQGPYSFASAERVRHDESLDQLADLYLTGLLDRQRTRPHNPLRAQSPVPAPQTVQNARLTMPEHETVVLQSDQDEKAQRPTPSPLPLPQQSMPSGTAPQRPNQRRLSRTKQSATSTLPEAVFLGNLPGFADAWLTQYAHHLAKEHGPVGVIRTDDKKFHLTMITPHNRAMADKQLDSDSPSEHQNASTTNRRPARWLVRMPTPTSTQQLEAARNLPNWTLLCGADDAAVVGAYRLLKQLLQEDSSEDSHLVRPKTIRLMVFGCDQQQAQAAAQKLNATVTSFLNAHIELIGSQPQMVPVGQTSLGSSEPDGDNFAERLRSVTGRVQSSSPHSVTAKLVESGDTDLHPEAHEPLNDILESAHQPIHDHQPGDTQRKPLSAATSPPPTLATESESQPLNILDCFPAGSTLLEARCPEHAEVRLVVSPEGELQIVGIEIDVDTAPTPTGKDLNAAFATLLHVKAWAHKHAELLSLTCPQCNLKPTSEPQVHLLTNHANPAAVTATQLGSVVKVHLMLRATIGSQSAWIGTQLN